MSLWKTAGDNLTLPAPAQDGVAARRKHAVS
jgi:hypothetical protein